MHSLTVGLAGRSYPIHVGTGLIGRLAEWVAPLSPSSIVIVTDETVGGLYAARAQETLATVARTSVATLSAGEQTKSWPFLAEAIDALVAHSCDRAALVIALGGGVIGDLAGFAASIYMRGIRYVQVPTTLLAQVDSSVGGKTAINHPRGKNLIGTFHQPALVVSDTDTLQTLDARQISAGLAEILKHGLLADAGYFEQVRSRLTELRQRDSAALADAIVRSCEIKAAIVARDERESGERALLNLGHTFAHAIEAIAGYGQWLHGEAVGCGLVLAADLSRRCGLISEADVEQVRSAVVAAGLPAAVDGLSAADALDAMRADKKAYGGQVRFIVLEQIGRARQHAVSDDRVLATLHAGGFR